MRKPTTTTMMMMCKSGFLVLLALLILCVPAARSLCPEGEGEVVVRITTDGRSDNDFTYWYLDKKNTGGGFPPYREVASVTLSDPQTEYVDILCIEEGEYFWGIYDCGGDGLCFRGNCPLSVTAGSLSVKVDGIEILTDQEFDLSLSIAFDYPLCPPGQGVLVVNVRTDDGADYNYWWLDEKFDDGPPFGAEVFSVTLDVPNKNYNDIRCIEEPGDYNWGIFDDDGDGLCYQGNCGGSQGTFHASVDGATIAPDQDFGVAVEVPFTYPYGCIDEPGTHVAVRPDGRLQAFTCRELADACEHDLPFFTCRRYCDVPLSLGRGTISGVCKDTCGEVDRGPCR